MRLALLLTAFLLACASLPEAARSSPPATTASTPSNSSAGCHPTTTRDASGVLTANGVVGVLGDTSTPSGSAMTDHLVIVRRGAQLADNIALRFDSVGGPATSVTYGVSAKVAPNPWGQFVFEAGWKPIGFSGSCWQLKIDGTDTGLVLEVRP
jgi:hypothetical protein